jgi:hypothetical protein
MHRTQLFAYSLVLGLAACGGGGGGGGGVSGGGSVSTRSPVPPQTALTYSGVTTDANVSATNASLLTSSVIGATDSGLGGSVLAGVSVQVDSSSAPQPTGASGLTRRLSKAIHGDEIARARSSGAVTGATLSQSIACDSGAINISGTVSDTNGTGTVAVDYVDCKTGPDTLNGPATLRIDGYDQAKRIITDGLLSFTRVRFSGPAVNYDLTGTLRTQVQSTPNFMGSEAATETLTQNFITQDNVTNHQTRTTNLTLANVYNTMTAPTFFNQSINGQVCDGTAGCVTISTSAAPQTDPWSPLYFATRSQLFPDWGIINLNGGAGRVRVTSLGVDLAKIEVDPGTGTFGAPARLRWSELNTALGANLADSDADGMHDSYETAKGLNPSANDANADADSDGYTNLTEYLQGSDAATSGSIPGGVRHLWLTGTPGVLDLAEVGGQIQVFLNSSSGVLLDPASAEVGNSFSGVAAPGNSGSRTTAADAQGRIFTLSPTASPTTWTLTSSTGASLTVNSVAGTNPGGLIRYGAHGLAFRTEGASTPGYVYLIDSPTLVP